MRVTTRAWRAGEVHVGSRAACAARVRMPKRLLAHLQTQVAHVELAGGCDARHVAQVVHGILEREAGEDGNVVRVRGVEERRVVAIRLQLVHPGRSHAELPHQRQVALPDAALGFDEKVLDAQRRVGGAHILPDGRWRVRRAAQQKRLTVELQGTICDRQARVRKAAAARRREGVLRDIIERTCRAAASRRAQLRRPQQQQQPLQHGLAFLPPQGRHGGEP